MSVKSDPVAQWRDLAAIHASVHAALDRELREHDLSPVEYEVLDVLASAPEARMQDVACGVHLNQSTCSRVGSAAGGRRGSPERAMCSNDRRGIYAKLTKEGRKRLEAAAPTYRRGTGRDPPAVAPQPSASHNARMERAPVIALIDGEHHPAAVRDALQRLDRERGVESVVFCGGEEKVLREVLAEPEKHYGFPVQHDPEQAMRGASSARTVWI